MAPDPPPGSGAQDTAKQPGRGGHVRQANHPTPACVTKHAHDGQNMFTVWCAWRTVGATTQCCTRKCDQRGPHACRRRHLLLPFSVWSSDLLLLPFSVWSSEVLWLLSGCY